MCLLIYKNSKLKYTFIFSFLFSHLIHKFLGVSRYYKYQMFSLKPNYQLPHKLLRYLVRGDDLAVADEAHVVQNLNQVHLS